MRLFWEWQGPKCKKRTAGAAGAAARCFYNGGQMNIVQLILLYPRDMVGRRTPPDRLLLNTSEIVTLRKLRNVDSGLIQNVGEIWNAYAPKFGGVIRSNAIEGKLI